MDSKKVALNDVHEDLGAQMVSFAGYLMPLKYTSVLQEHKTVRSSVGIFDVSHMGEFLIEGPEAKDLLQKVTTNDIEKLFDGRAQYSCFTNEKGGIVDDLLVYRISENKYMTVVNASNIEKDWKWINSHNNFNAQLTNISDNTCLFAIQGPKAIDVCQKLTSIDLSEVSFYNFRIGDFDGVSDVVISATGYTGSGGFELYINSKEAEKIWNDLLKAGKRYSIQPAGLAARDTLRLEMGLCLYGNDIDDNTTPLEAGLGWITKLDTNFIGSEPLRSQKEKGIEKKLIGFEMIDKGIPRKGYEIYNEDQKLIGEVTSGTQSPSLGVGIGMGYVKKEFSKPETKLLIKIRNKYLTAEVVKLPIYRGNEKN